MRSFSVYAVRIPLLLSDLVYNREAASHRIAEPDHWSESGAPNAEIEAANKLPSEVRLEGGTRTNVHVPSTGERTDRSSLGSKERPNENLLIRSRTRAPLLSTQLVCPSLL